MQVLFLGLLSIFVWLSGAEARFPGGRRLEDQLIDPSPAPTVLVLNEDRTAPPTVPLIVRDGVDAIAPEAVPTVDSAMAPEAAPVADGGIFEDPPTLDEVVTPAPVETAPEVSPAEVPTLPDDASTDPPDDLVDAPDAAPVAAPVDLPTVDEETATPAPMATPVAAPTAAPYSSPVFVPNTSIYTPEPTPRPQATYVTNDDDDGDPVKPFDPTEGGINDGDKWVWNNSEIEELEHDQTVLIALLSVLGVGILLSICVAQQMLENPNGCCAR